MSNAETADKSRTGILSIMDLSSPLRRIYQAVLKNADVSPGELSGIISNEPTEELRMYLNLLERLGYLEKYSGKGEIRFRLRGRMRGNDKLPDDIWNRLK